MPLSLLLALFLASGATAQEKELTNSQEMKEVAKSAEATTEKPEDTPWILRWMIRPLKRGMLVRLPIMDTDPNRGTTVGFMPIWVIQEDNSDRIIQIHAPSLTYNKTFKAIPTYRYYYYPTDDSGLILRGNLSQNQEREIMGQFDDAHFLGKNWVVSTKAQFNVDGAKRFYGIGPNRPKTDQTNYIDNVVQFYGSLGVPIVADTKWKIHFSEQLMGQRILNGRTPNLKPFDTTFPGIQPNRRQQINQFGVAVDYDSRDHGNTTSKGAYFRTYMLSSIKKVFSSYNYQRYGTDVRYFLKSGDSKRVTAIQFKYDQMTNKGPFWLMPSIGGKNSLRAYGEGRYVDRGAAVVNLEERFTLHSAGLAGVTTEFELAPFVGVGSVFDTPKMLTARYLRPVYGLAIRAVAKPQVVGSMDFGVGQEGLAAFIDINYSF